MHIAAGSLAGGAKAATRRSGATPKIRRGGRLIWALESDPVHVAPFGQILTSDHWGKEVAYDSLVEWDKNLNVKPALATSFKIVSRPSDPLEPAEGRQVPQRQGARRRRRRVLGREDARPAASGQHLHRRPGAGDRRSADVVSKYVVRLRLKKPDARVIGFFAWGRYAPIVPGGLYDQINVSRNAIGTGPYRMVGFNPNDRVEYVANQSFWKSGQPYMDAMTLKTLPDEQARIAALRAGSIDGATVSSTSRSPSRTTRASSS